MCGIYFSLGRSTQDGAAASSLNAPLRSALTNRGPHLQTEENRVAFTTDAHATFYSTVLALRGGCVGQPLVSKHECRLCWNGEAWRFDDKPVTDNDASFVFDVLVNASRADFIGARKPLSEDGAVLKALSRIAGPFAFVFFDKLNSRVYFGRDRMGRRSLLMSHTADMFSLSSVVPSDGQVAWTEVEASGIHVLEHLSEVVEKSNAENDTLTPQADFLGSVDISLSCFPFPGKSIPGLNRSTPLDSQPGLYVESPAVFRLESMLRTSLAYRVLDIPFDPLIQSKKESNKSSSRLALLFSGGLDCTVLARLVHDILPLDAPVDLLNVAFENPRILLHEDPQRVLPPASCFDKCPDRVTGRASFLELHKICPGRQWNLVEIDTLYAETRQHRERIKALIYPHNTEMDFSICCALYFASRGTGRIRDVTGELGDFYKSTARVLLSGLGADELFGGYQRHALAFSRHGHDGLCDELELDIGRLGKRNLGRDDRVIACWGREVRYPYLDEDLVCWEVGAPIWEKCGFGQQEIGSSAEGLTPDKLVLRLLAHKLDMKNVAKEKKRAVSPND